MSKTSKIVKEFSYATLSPYKRTLREIRQMSHIERGVRLQAMKEFLSTLPKDKKIWSQEEEQLPHMATSLDQPTPPPPSTRSA